MDNAEHTRTDEFPNNFFWKRQFRVRCALCGVVLQDLTKQAFPLTVDKVRIRMKMHAQRNAAQFLSLCHHLAYLQAD